MSLSGKVIALTGAASGIGLETAKLLASHGAKLALVDAQERPLQTFQKELIALGIEVEVTVVDVRLRADVERWAQKTVQTFGRFDGAVTCAGVTGRQLTKAGIHNVEDDDWDFVFAVNVKGTLNTLRALIPLFNDGASIVTVASLAGLVGMPNNAAYVASKHAVVGLSRTATIELGSRNIRVNCICPGSVDTPMIAALDGGGDDTYKKLSPLGRNGQPSEIANLIYWLLSDGSSFVTGTTQVIDGGFLNQ